MVTLFLKFERSSVLTLISKNIWCNTAKDYLTIFKKYIINHAMTCPQFEDHPNVQDKDTKRWPFKLSLWAPVLKQQQQQQQQ